MMHLPANATPSSARTESSESGVALILVLIFSILLYIIVAELVTTGRTARLVGENAALLSRMRNHLEYTLTQVEQVLIDDLAAAAAGDEGAGGGIPGLGGGGGDTGLGGGLGAGGEGGEEGDAAADPAATADCSQDAWYPSTPYAEGDITTYALVEDENRKFNILALVSKDQDFAKESVERFIRLVDSLREDTDFDVDSSTARRMSTEIVEWMQARQRNPDGIPRPPLKSDDPSFDSISVPLHMDELMALNSVTPELFYDLVFDNRVHLGLESVLTIWTSTALDPGDPEKNRRREQRTNRTPDAGGGANPGEDPGDGGAGSEGGEGEGGDPGDPEDPDAEPEPEGVGIKININTATWPVLRCLVDRSEIADSVIEALLRYRNEEVEDDVDSEASYDSELLLGEEAKKQVFGDLSALEEVDEWANIANLEAKDKFLSMLTTTSDVFSVHLASIYKRNEERRVYVIRKARTIFRREEGGDAGGILIPLGPILEVRHGVRVMPIDFQDEVDYGSQYLESEMDYFAQEERIWDPFRLEFYMTEEHRSQFFEKR